jgi:hypothetical protein
MCFQQIAADDCPHKRFAGLFGTGVWILASLIPATFLVRLFALTLYAIPESDDFCISYQNATIGMIETARVWYLNAVGRIVPLLLIQIPGAISKASGIDYFLTYTATLVAFEIGLAGAALLLAFRLWPQAKPWQNAFMAAALLATMLTRVPTIQEMLFWLPGVTCYLLPGAIVAIVLVEFVRATEAGTRIGSCAAYGLAIASFVASLCNEFTPAWLIGLLFCSLIARAIFRQELQVKAHAIVGVAALVGFLIMLVAPGNTVRIGQFPHAGDLSRSISEAYLVSKDYFDLFFSGRPIQVWLVVVAIFSAMQPEVTRTPAWKGLLLSVLVPTFCLACGYLAHFTAQYSIGGELAPRAQNQVMMLLVVGSTIGVAALARAVRSAIPLPAVSLIGSREAHSTIAAVLMAALLVLPLYGSTTMKVMRSEGSSLRIFWLESMERHARLALSTEANVTVARHSAAQTALSGGDLGDDPKKLPNDCVAQFYGKKTVTLTAPK